TPRSRSTGSWTAPKPSRPSASPPANRSTTPTSTATGSPTSSSPPSSTAGGNAAPPVDQVAPTPHAPSAPVDPGQFGAEGTGGTPSPETEALLKYSNVVFDSTGIADLKAGRIDPRVVAVLTKLSEDHKITVSCMCSDHSKFTTG